MGTFFVLTPLLVAMTYLRRVGADARALAVQAMVDGARHALPVAIACALVGVIIGIINLTGVAAELGGHIIAIGRNSLFLALLLTMVTCLVLGMGIPTIPTTSSPARWRPRCCWNWACRSSFRTCSCSISASWPT